MAKVANAGEHHGHAGLVSCRNHLLIANGTPGRIVARMPASAAASIPSRKEASEAMTEPATWLLIRSLDARNLGAETRLICPVPTPMVRWAEAYTMASILRIGRRSRAT